MENFIEFLKLMRDVRIKNKIELTEISVKSRIPITILKKFDAFDLTNISDFYVKSYIRQCVKIIDDKELTAIFESQYPLKDNLTHAELNKEVTSSSYSLSLDGFKNLKIKKPRFATRKNILPILTIAAILLSIFFVLRFLGFVISTAIKNNQQNSSSKKIETKKIEKKVSSKSKSKTKSSKNESKSSEKLNSIIAKVSSSHEKNNDTSNSNNPITSNESYKLPQASLIAKDDIFVVVKKDGSVVFKSILYKGSRETWTAESSLEIRISNPSLAMLVILGKDVPTANNKKNTEYVINSKGFFTK